MRRLLGSALHSFQAGSRTFSLGALLSAGLGVLTTIPLQITFREWAAGLTLAALIVGGGLLPQPGVRSRYKAAHDSFAISDALQPSQPNAGH